MKESGMVRRVDELGRLVIPIEIRKNLGIKTGDEMEMYLNESNIILKKYSKLKEKELYLQEYANTLGNNYLSVCITDVEKVIYNKNQNGEIFDGEKLYDKTESIILKRNPVLLSGNRVVKTCQKELNNYLFCYVYPICVSGDIYGALIVKNNLEFTQYDLGRIETVADLIEKLI